MTATTERSAAGAVSGAAITIALCFAVAVLEGFDIQAMGVAAPKLGPELKLDKAILGQALAGSNIGLVIGAALGGWLADRLGRKPVLIASVLVFGAFTLMTMVARTYETMFAVRLITGLGFGAALPNIMAMAAEVAAKDRRGSTAAMMFCGMPVGGGSVALVSWLAHPDWRTLFLIGGLAPIVIAPALFFLLKETRSEAAKAEAAAQRVAQPWWVWVAIVVLFGLAWLAVDAVAALPAAASIRGIAPWIAGLLTLVIGYALVHRATLFGGGRGGASVLLWVTFVPTLLILYLILNWLPTLVVAKGFPQDASQASVWFNFGSVAGALILGRVVDRFGVRWPLTLAYAGLIAALVGLAAVTDKMAIMLLSGAVGFTLLGANYALYGAAAAYYPEAMRGRGSGAAVAWGRFGAVAGPLAGGYLLAGGAAAGDVVSSMIPFAVIAGIGVFILTFVGKPADA